jgi:superoxide dismutase
MPYPFEVPALGYSFDALEPVIDAKTMEIHHDKHHGAYVTNLNKALEGAPELQNRDIEALLKDINAGPGKNPYRGSQQRGWAFQPHPVLAVDCARGKQAARSGRDAGAHLHLRGIRYL